MKSAHLQADAERRPMLKQRSHETEFAAVSRVNRLLSLLRVAMRHEPPPALRARLAEMSSEHLSKLRTEENPRKSPERRPAFSVPAFGSVAALLIAGAACIGFLIHEESHPARVKHVASAPSAPPAIPVPRNVEGPQSAVTPQRRNRAPRSGTYRGRPGLVIPLPYSDTAVNTGSSAIIRVSLSQAELLSLGVPVNPSIRNRQFVAEMILGDDGLPRAISVPLPLTVIEEGK
jgi:hypothetical protein